MIREILFKAKRRDNQEWIIGYYCKYGDNHCIIEPTEFGLAKGVGIIPETLGQFTGLTDKNGKRIFEGDILQEFSEYENKPIGEKRVMRYGFDQTDIISVYGFSPCDKNGKPTGDLWLGSYYEKNVAEEVVVVGNVHDNPELLTAERSE